MNPTEFALWNLRPGDEPAAPTPMGLAPMTYAPKLTDEEKAKLIEFLEARTEYVVEVYGTSNTVAGRWLGIGRTVELTDLILILKEEKPR